MPADGSLTDDVNIGLENRDLRAANQRLQRSLQRAKAREADLVEAVHQAALDAAVTVGRSGPIPPPGKDRRKSPEVALLHLTDWQLGKVTPDFDPAVCEARVREAVRKTVRLAEIQRADHAVNDVHLMLGGDLVEGVTVFPGQPFEVDSTLFEQVFRAADLVESIILTLLDAFQSVTVWEVAGNHGRIGRRGDVSRGDNWDRILYRIARDKLRDQPRLAWAGNDGWYQIVEVGTYRALLVHGDQIKSFGGNVPAYGVLRKANGWQAGAIPEPFQDVYLGHMHQPMTLQMASGGLVYMTPSVESGSAYAREFMAAHGRPGQRLHFIEPARGRVTASYLIEFDE